MTTTTAPSQTDETTGQPSLWHQLVGLARRVPLGWHAVALAIVLLTALPLLDVGAIGSADEGAALVQAEILHRTGDWGVTSPTESIDPSGHWFPIELSERSGDRWYPYTKHTIYPQLLSVALDLGGYRGVLALQVLGVVGTALAAAFIARRIAPDHVRLTLWALGLGSPLFFDGYWAIAHSLACVGAALAVLGALRAREGHRLDGSALLVVGIGMAVAMRSEGTLFGLALAAAIVVCGWRTCRGESIVLGAIAGITSIVGYLGSAELERIALGGTDAAPFRIEDARQGFLEGRVTGLWHSLLSPQLGGRPLTWLLCLVAAIGCFVAWWFARVRPRETVIITTAALGAWAIWTIRLALPVRPVPGLLIASPLAVAGLVSWRGRLRTPTRDLVLATAAIFSLAVLATQYGTGGTGDWGGRYFRLVLPLLVPLCLVATTDAVSRLTPRLRSVLVVSLVGSCAALTLLAGLTLRRMHVVTDERVEATTELATSLQSAGDVGGPVVVTTRNEFGRYAWEHVLDGRYLAVSNPDQLPDVPVALAAAGVEDFVFVGLESELDERLPAVTADGYEVTKRVSVPGVDWSVAVLSRRG